MIIKKILLSSLTLTSICSVSFARGNGDTGSAGQNFSANPCKDTAIAALVQRLGVTKNQVTYLGGSMVGDGEASISVHVLNVKQDTYVPYIVRFTTDSADYCDVKASQAIIELL